ncbi:protein FAR1-RELATED SEQUENCE 9-like [Iris pallida]|uniref:Protein FAR1-RELATED SEQUENCE n=1 Tax=Iris pallida TaxID=29817 RepID=A0AAX6E5H9_IRIPA|nr:protein FAR1-RELATED SEQUENCE 9-like [Iris pallida]
MSTTQRSESMNAFFDGYVHSKTSLKLFVQQYENALRYKMEKEIKSDAKSFSKTIPTTTPYEMEKQAQSVYTIAKFKEFQHELIGKMFCEVIGVQEDTTVKMYDVQEEVWIPKSTLDETSPEIETEKVMKKVTFKVSFQKDECQLECSCHRFEFRGILCKHAICVLLRNGITLLPERYILRRWRKDVRRSHTKIPINSDGWQLTPDQVRYNELCNLFAELADVASPIDDECIDIKKWIDKKLKAITKKGSSNGSSSRLNIDLKNVDSEVNETEKVLDPPITKRKGRPRGKRLEPTRYKKKGKSGKENIEVNDEIPTQQSMANIVQSSGVNRAPNAITYEQYHQLMVAQLSRDGHAVNVVPAYGAPQLWGSSHYANATPSYGITQRHGASEHFDYATGSNFYSTRPPLM